MGVTDWVAKMLDLPSEFLNFHEGHGAGMIQVRFRKEKKLGMFLYMIRICHGSIFN